MAERSVSEILKYAAHVIEPDDSYDAILREIGNASIVLLGEATHGTQEFYRARAKISRRLISDFGFDAIAVEADWPDALRVSRYVRGRRAPHADRTVDEALEGFQRFPLWMWRNTEIVDLISWLHEYNAHKPAVETRVGFYGIDLYSLRSSMQAVIQYLQQVDPDAARQARARYSCFDHFAEEPQRYGYAASFGMKKDCEDEVVRQLMEMTANAGKYLVQDGSAAQDEQFYAEQNARVAQNAEAYYRAMFKGRDESWNLRDTHMADTLDALRNHLSQQKGRPAKIVVWAHNSHIGDARATEMGSHGQLNLGQLVRERYRPEETYLLGFTTHTGTVTAASEWDCPAELKAVRPSRSDSVENLLHHTRLGNFFLPIRGRDNIATILAEQRLERAIGVIYLPETERWSHYFHASLAQQFDGVIHFDKTRALQPLDRSAYWQHEEVPETYPSGM